MGNGLKEALLEGWGGPPAKGPPAGGSSGGESRMWGRRRRRSRSASAFSWESIPGGSLPVSEPPPESRLVIPASEGREGSGSVVRFVNHLVRGVGAVMAPQSTQEAPQLCVFPSPSPAEGGFWGWREARQGAVFGNGGHWRRDGVRSTDLESNHPLWVRAFAPRASVSHV